MELELVSRLADIEDGEQLVVGSKVSFRKTLSLSFQTCCVAEVVESTEGGHLLGRAPSSAVSVSADTAQQWTAQRGKKSPVSGTTSSDSILVAKALALALVANDSQQTVHTW